MTGRVTRCVFVTGCVTGRAFVTRGVTWRAHSRSQGLRIGFIPTILTPRDSACSHHVTAPHTRSHAASQMHSASHPMSQCTPGHTPRHGPSPQGVPPCRVHHIALHIPLAGHTSCQHARSTPRRVTRRVTASLDGRAPCRKCTSSHPSTPLASRPNPSVSSRVAPHVPHFHIVPHLLHTRSRSLSQMCAGSRPMSRSCTPPSHAPRRSPSCMRYAVPYDCPVDCPVNPRAHPPA